MFNIGPEELLLILVIALIVFGPRRLPEIGRTLGRSLREFRRASEGVRQEFSRALDVEDDQDGFDGTFATAKLPEQPAGPEEADGARSSPDRAVGPGREALQDGEGRDQAAAGP